MDGSEMVNFPTVCLLGLFLRWTVSQFPYSGFGKAPMYGDYEAQRHWQEITVNLPLEDWYRNTTDNDLLYWGLDYPPLTAYHSYLCGLVAKKLNPKYVSLHSSRGFESYDHKLFMRYTVLVVDLFLYFPAAYILTKCLNSGRRSKDILQSYSCFIALILYPGLYLIDYGHFQYNNASLALFLMAVSGICHNKECVAAFCFSLAVNYKQMELYHSLPFFFYILGNNFQKRKASSGSIANCLVHISKIGLTVIVTFLCCWFPFLKSPDIAHQILRRLFPIERGVFEDKVANFWCSLNIFIKLKLQYSSSFLALLCLITTVLLLIPSCIHIYRHPTLPVFLYSLVNCSFIFFLFSFHVHEKSILLVAIPICLVYNKEPFFVRWFFIVSVFSMLPLLLKDGLLIPYFCLTCLSFNFSTLSGDLSKYSLSVNKVCRVFEKLSLFGIGVLSLLTITLAAPDKYPDLFPVLISLFSFGHFILFCIYFHYCQYKCVGQFENQKFKLK